MRSSSSTKPKPKPAPLTEVKHIVSRQRSPVNSTINSARLIPKKSLVDENISFQFTKNELEQRIQEFVDYILKNKTLAKASPQNYVNELKNIFSVLAKGNQRILSRSNSSEIKAKELASLLKEAEMQKQIRELEEYKISYQEKIDNHALYIMDLEQKVDILIREYEKTLTINQNLTMELEASKYETSILDEPKDQMNTSLLAEIEQSRKKNFDLQKNMRKAKETISDLESKLKNSIVLEEQNHDLKKQIQQIQDQLKQIKTQNDELEASYRLGKDLKRENQSLKEQLQEKIEKIEKMAKELEKSAEQLVQQEQRSSSESETVTTPTIKSEDSTTNKDAQNELVDAQNKIEDLTTLLKKANEELEESQNKCAMFEIELESKERLEALTRALRKKIETLETQVESLTEDKIRSQSIHDGSPSNIVGTEAKDTVNPSLDFGDFTEKLDQEKEYNYGYLKDLVSSKEKDENGLREILERKEKEIEEERNSFKSQIEKYGINLTMLSNKIQMLVKINESMGKDFEYVKYDYKNYRNAVWSVYQEIRKQLDFLRSQDLDVENLLENNSNVNSENFNSLLSFYAEVRRRSVYIDNLVEDRRHYI